MSESPGKVYIPEEPTDHRDHDRNGRKIPALARKDNAMKRFFDHADMESLKLFTENASSGDDKYSTFLAMLADPDYARLSPLTIARKANVTLQELQDVYTNGQRHLGLLRMANHLPDVMEDVAVDALTTMSNCPRCDGFKMVPAPEGATRPCPTCHGEGEIRRMGDKHARDLVFESAKLTNQNGPVVAIQNNVYSGDSRMESMLKRTRQIVLEPREPKKIDNPSEET